MMNSCKNIFVFVVVTALALQGCRILGKGALMSDPDAVVLQAGQTRFVFEPLTQRFQATYGDRTLSFQNVLPVFAPDGIESILEDSALTAKLVSSGIDGQEHWFDYRDERESVIHEYQVRLSTRDGSLLINLSSGGWMGRAVCAPKVNSIGTWRRVETSQYGLAHGQTWYQGAWYFDEARLWLWGFWELDAGNASSWGEQTMPNSGSGEVHVASPAFYLPDRDGVYQPLRETLTIRVSDQLWDAVPSVANPPSRYRKELSQMVFLDIWNSHPAAEVEHFQKCLNLLAGDYVSFYTVFQNWQTGGFDSLLPDSIQMPEYPPNEAIGTVKQLRRTCRVGKRLGRFCFRTNYQMFCENSPSARAGIARAALDEQGNAKWHTRADDALALALRQEPEIRRLLSSNAPFTDQLASGGSPKSYLDFNPMVPEGNTMRWVASKQRELADYLQSVVDAPLGSETLNAEYLLGRWVATGDFGVMNGHSRFLCPDYKLRRLHHLSTFHGMGLFYRFFELPRFPNFSSGRRSWQTDASLQDSYRCCEVLFGNGGYIYALDLPWNYILTECFVIGRLQRYYALQKVKSILYQQEDEWKTLEQLVEEGNPINFDLWAEQSPLLARIRIEYENGLTVVVNRAEAPLMVNTGKTLMKLPQNGWAAWGAGILAYSAYFPGTQHRVDFLQEDESGLEYLDPRGGVHRATNLITLWQHGKIILQVDSAKGCAYLKGTRIDLRYPKPAPLVGLNFDFSEGSHGWMPEHGILKTEQTPDGVKLHCISDCPFLMSPPLALDADAIKKISIRLHSPKGAHGKLYFLTKEDPRLTEEQVYSFQLNQGDDWQTVEIEPHTHSKWSGQTVVQLRLDPAKGVMNSAITLGSIRGE